MVSGGFIHVKDESIKVSDISSVRVDLATSGSRRGILTFTFFSGEVKNIDVDYYQYRTIFSNVVTAARLVQLDVMFAVAGRSICAMSDSYNKSHNTWSVKVDLINSTSVRVGWFTCKADAHAERLSLAERIGRLEAVVRD